MARVPAAYWVEGEGTVTLDDEQSDEMTVPGRLRMNYLVYPDQRVVVPTLVAWIDDLDLVVTFTFFEFEPLDVEVEVETHREKLRCATLRNDGAIEGTLHGGEIVLPAGTAVEGQYYSKRGDDGRCSGSAKGLAAESDGELRAVHDPEGDRFALEGSFEVTYEAEDGEHEYELEFEIEGDYLNRPPVAAFSFDDPELQLLENGCPKSAAANDAKGYKVGLISQSWDPDGIWPGEPGSQKTPRVDLDFEHWGRSTPEGFSFVGAGREIGPLVFEAGREHQLLLWVTDRRGAEARKFCQFQVVE